MKRVAILLTLALLFSLSAGAAPSVVSQRADGIPTFLKGDLGNIDPLGDEKADSELFRLSAKNFLQGLVLERFGASGDEELEPAKVRRDALGTVHVRFTETIHGLPVAGAGMIVHADAATGEVYAVNGDFVPSKGLPVSPRIDAIGALKASLADAGIRGTMQAAPELGYVLGAKGDRAFLAWTTLVEYHSADGLERDLVFADAMTGELVARHPTVHRAKSRKTYSANNGTSLPGSLLCTDGQSCGDSAAQDAHDFAGATYDYYSAKFGRDSLDDAGFQLKSTVHYDSNYNNAFWNSSQMVYGDGDGTTFSPLSGALDVVAHELTHGVTEFESGLVYQNESGALNEALSDIFSAAVEVYVVGSINSNTWKLGEDIYTPGTSGDALRYMDDPTADGQSYDYYPERYTGSADNGGVHLNSGIANLAFVLLVEGGTHPQGKTSIDVPALGMSKAEQIFYRAQTTYLTSSSNFQAARNATTQAASDLYGSTEVDAVDDAWCAVGVPGCPAGSSELSNGVPVTGLSGSSGSQSFYTLDVPAGATNLTVQTSGGSGDADLYVRFASAPTTSTYDCRSWASGNTESCSFAAPSTGTYHVMVNAYSTYSGMTLTASYDEPSGGGGELSNGVPETNLSGSAGSETFYTIDVPAGATNLVVQMSGGSGDGDLYVRFGSAPTTSTYDCRPYLNGNNETCTIASPSAGTYHVMIRAYSAYSGVSLVASYDEAAPSCDGGGDVSGISGSAGEEDRYYLDVPACASTLTVEISGGSGDSDLYVRFNSQPTTSAYDCRPYLNGNNEVCTFQNPAEGRWHIMVRGYTSYSGVLLEATYE